MLADPRFGPPYIFGSSIPFAGSGAQTLTFSQRITAYIHAVRLWSVNTDATPVDTRNRIQFVNVRTGATTWWENLGANELPHQNPPHVVGIAVATGPGQYEGNLLPFENRGFLNPWLVEQGNAWQVQIENNSATDTYLAGIMVEAYSPAM